MGGDGREGKERGGYGLVWFGVDVDVGLVLMLMGGLLGCGP